MDTIKNAKNKPRKKTPACETEKDMFASRLREIMEERGINQSQLEKLIKDSGDTLQRQTISLYMNGQSKPDTGRLTVLCRILNISSDWLLGLTDTRSPSMEIRGMCEHTGLDASAINTLHHIPLIADMLNLLFADPGALVKMCTAMNNLYDCAASLMSSIDRGDYDYDQCRKDANISLFDFEDSMRQIPIYQGVRALKDQLKSPEEIAIERIMGEAKHGKTEET